MPPGLRQLDTIIIGTTDEVNSLDADDAYATHDWEIIKNTGAACCPTSPAPPSSFPAQPPTSRLLVKMVFPTPSPSVIT